MRFRPVTLAAAIALAMFAAACGSDDPVTVIETTDPEAPVDREESPATSATADLSETAGTGGAVAAGPGDVPDLQMIDVHTGATLDLQSVVDGRTPLLFWFWAPH